MGIILLRALCEPLMVAIVELSELLPASFRRTLRALVLKIRLENDQQILEHALLDVNFYAELILLAAHLDFI
ncbi:hypothetical protein T10_3427 [Trichinella papuae]|uniref:Uncharacterized protein n=1 Tax=Trichinella papuae TaxID=268474 RepID=A0A0V1MJJ0_9BILA|nr:hypothetical protein T10_3427 [Trichinella papuae]